MKKSENAVACCEVDQMVRVPGEVIEMLEDFCYQYRKKEHKRITKREVVDKALRLFLTSVLHP